MNSDPASIAANETRILFPLTIYYDAACPLCASEMRALKEADADNKLVLVNCSAAGFDDRSFRRDGVTREAMLRLIHARDAAGRWFKGVEVFEVAYDAAGFSALADLWRHRQLRPWWNRVYPWVARHRYTLSRLGFAHLFRFLVQGAHRKTMETAPAMTHSCGFDSCKQTPQETASAGPCDRSG